MIKKKTIKNKEKLRCGGCYAVPRKLVRTEEDGHITIRHRQCGHILAGWQE